jgi:hypothetical protein
VVDWRIQPVNRQEVFDDGKVMTDVLLVEGSE